MKNRSPIIFYELNEVPWRVIDWFIDKNPQSNIKKILSKSISLTSVTKDEGELHPWSTWPTLHRGVYNNKHRIQFLNQDLECAQNYPPLWEILAQSGVKVGVFGSLQSYPVAQNLKYSFYVPDTFAPLPDTLPESLRPFQCVNLRQTKADGAIPTQVKIDREFLLNLLKLKGIGLKFSTYFQLAHQIYNEKRNALFSTRRSMMQAPVAFDIFFKIYKKYRPDFATFFTNHAAGMMHRFWKYSFPSDFNYSVETEEESFKAENILIAMKIADKQIGILKEFLDKINGQLIILSSMGQEAIDRGNYFGEIRIEDMTRFARGIGFNKPFKDHLAMQPDFNLEFHSSEDLEEFLSLIQKLVDSEGKPVFFRTRTQNKTLNLGLSSSQALLEQKAIFIEGNSKKIPFEEIGFKPIFRDMGTGYHQPKGIIIWYHQSWIEGGDRKEIESISIAPTILKIFDSSISDYHHRPISEVMERQKVVPCHECKI